MQSDFQAYFGGLAECLGELEDHDPKELVCGGCSIKERAQVISYCFLCFTKYM